jgi:hypothetical protein
MIKHAYQGSTEAADEIRQELVERYKAMQPAKMQPCAGRNCGSTDPNLHSAECFEDYEKATGMNRQEPVAVGEVVNERGEVDYISYVPPVGTALYTTPPAAQREWVGLTDEEIIDVIHPLVVADLSDEQTDYEIAKAIEAKVRSKNNG